MAVFVSYARRNKTEVDNLCADIAKAHRQVWIDSELTGGQSWWDAILEQIRTCEVFVLALSHDSLRSRACMAELNYALDLQRPVLAVMVQEVEPELTPDRVARSQMVKYLERSADTAFALANALHAMPVPGPLPSPLPKPPVIPISYLNQYRELVEAPSLTFEQQSMVVLELRRYLDDEDLSIPVRRLLEQLRRRGDIAEAVGRDVDTLLARHGATVGAGAATGAGANSTAWGAGGTSNDTTTSAGATSSTTTTTAPAPGWYADPTRRFDQRYWDGRTWTENVARAGVQAIDPLRVAAAAAGGAARTTTAAATTGSATTSAAPPPVAARSTFTAPSAGASSAPSTAWGTPPPVPMRRGWTTSTLTWLYIASFFTAGIAGIIVGAINWNHPANRQRARTMLWVSIGWLVLCAILSQVGNGGSNS